VGVLVGDASVDAGLAGVAGITDDLDFVLPAHSVGARLGRWSIKGIG
jgi:hypothetical protein